jgi:hypothetical protein
LLLAGVGPNIVVITNSLRPAHNGCERVKQLLRRNGLDTGMNLRAIDMISCKDRGNALYFMSAKCIKRYKSEDLEELDAAIRARGSTELISRAYTPERMRLCNAIVLIDDVWHRLGVYFWSLIDDKDISETSTIIAIGTPAAGTGFPDALEQHGWNVVPVNEKTISG